MSSISSKHAPIRLLTWCGGLWLVAVLLGTGCSSDETNAVVPEHQCHGSRRSSEHGAGRGVRCGPNAL